MWFRDRRAGYQRDHYPLAASSTFSGTGSERPAIVPTGSETPNFKLWGVPKIPPHFLERATELEDLRQKLLGNTSSVGIFGLQGMGGIGKTVLASALVRDERVQSEFPDGIYWVTVGIEPQLIRQQTKLAEALSGHSQSITDVQQGKERLQECFAGKRCLLILDDVWQAADAKVFDALDESGQLLLTTRDREIITVLGATEHTLGLLNEQQSLTLLAEWSGCSIEELGDNARDVARECGNLPLALSLCGAMVRDGIPWEDVREALEEADLAFIEKHFPNYPYTGVLKALEASVLALEEADASEAERYRELAICAADEAAPETAVVTLWGHTGNLSARKVRLLLRKLAGKGLLQQETETTERHITLHDLQHDYLRAMQAERGSMASLHQQVLEAYGKQCPAGWASGPDDGYFFQKLAYHLVRAGREPELKQLLLNFDWLATQIAVTSNDQLITDYDRLPDDEALNTIQKALKLSGHILCDNPTPSQLAGQLLGRLLSISSSENTQLLEQAKQSEKVQNTVWLQSLVPALTPPGGPLLQTLKGHSDYVRSVAIAPDGKRAVSASYDSTLMVWDLASGQALHTLTGHSDYVYSVAIAPDGKRAAAASGDRTLMVWDLVSGQCVAKFYGDSPFYACAIAPNGITIIAGDQAGNVHFLRLMEPT